MKGAQKAMKDEATRKRAALKHVRAWEQQWGNAAWVDCMDVKYDPMIEAPRHFDSLDFGIEATPGQHAGVKKAQI